MSLEPHETTQNLAKFYFEVKCLTTTEPKYYYYQITAPRKPNEEYKVREVLDLFFELHRYHQITVQAGRPHYITQTVIPIELEELDEKQVETLKVKTIEELKKENDDLNLRIHYAHIARERQDVLLDLLKVVRKQNVGLYKKTLDACIECAQVAIASLDE